MFNKENLMLKIFTWYVFVGELDVDDVVSGLGGFVCDATWPIFIIQALNVCLAGTLNGEAQTAVACQGKNQLHHSLISSKLNKLLHRNKRYKILNTVNPLFIHVNSPKYSYQ